MHALFMMNYLSFHFTISQKNAIFDFPNQTITEGYTKPS
jgi:hypothetical protein